MFNNKSLLRSKAYRVITELESAADMLYDGTRLVIGSYQDGTSTTNYANYITTVDSNFNVYKHTAGSVNSNYAHFRLAFVNNTLFSSSYSTALTSGLLYGMHKWDASYNWVSSDVPNRAGYCGGGIVASDNYLWGFDNIAGTALKYQYAYDTTTVPVSTSSISTSYRFSNSASQGKSCYNNTRVFFNLVTFGDGYYAAYSNISGSTLSAPTYISIPEMVGNIYGAAVVNGKSFHYTGAGAVTLIDCATLAYTYLGILASSLRTGSLLCVIDDYIYLTSSTGTSSYCRFNSLTNTIEEFPKENNDALYSICKGFDDKMFATLRSDIDNKHYLVQLDI